MVNSKKIKDCFNWKYLAATWKDWNSSFVRFKADLFEVATKSALIKYCFSKS